jgi:hypothetical protein
MEKHKERESETEIARHREETQTGKGAQTERQRERDRQRQRPLYFLSSWNLLGSVLVVDILSQVSVMEWPSVSMLGGLVGPYLL